MTHSNPPRVQLKRLATCTLGKMVQGTAKEGMTSAPYLRAAHVQPEGRLIDLPDQQMWFTASELASLTLRSGDIAVVEGGAGYGRSAVLREDLVGWGFQNSIVRVRPIPGKSEGRFLDYTIQAALLSGEIESSVSTATIPHFTAEKVARLPISEMPVEAQRVIADFLDRETAQIDAFIAQNEQLITLLTERRAAVVDDLVWNGASRDAARSSVGKGLPSSPVHWARVRNKQLYRERNEASVSGDEELLTVSHITGVTPRAEKNVTMFEAVSTVGYKLVHPGDLVINTMWAWMGALGVSRHRGIASPSYGVYQGLRNLPYDLRYFDYLYRSAPYVAMMTVHSRGITDSRLRLYPDVFLALPVIVPPLTEQQQIVQRITAQTDHIDKLLLAADRSIELARERRAALISAAVTGKIDVGVNA